MLQRPGDAAGAGAARSGVHVMHVMEATIGGTRRHLVDVVLGQLARDCRVDVVASAERQPDFREDLARLSSAGAWVSELPMVRAIRPPLDWRHQRRVAAILRERRPDVVHTHSSKAGVLGRRASMATGIGRRVHTPHTFAFLFAAMFSKPKRKLLFAVERHLARRTHAVIAVSATEADSIRRSGVVPAERIRVVPNGIDPAPWKAARPLDRSELDLPAGVPVAAVVGLLNVAKGQDLLLQAVAAARVPDLHLLVAGSGEMEDELRAQAAELGIAARVRFLGFRRDVPALVATADFVVLPSRWEGMPYIVLEAMAGARPVLATAVDGGRELVKDGETGIVVPVEDVQALSRGLERLAAMSLAERTRLGDAGCRRASSSFSRAAMIDGLLDVYGEVLERTPALEPAGRAAREAASRPAGGGPAA